MSDGVCPTCAPTSGPYLGWSQPRPHLKRRCARCRGYFGDGDDWPVRHRFGALLGESAGLALVIAVVATPLWLPATTWPFWALATVFGAVTGAPVDRVVFAAGICLWGMFWYWVFFKR